MGLKLFLTAVVLLYITSMVQCSHFRGMIIQWAPDDPDNISGDKSITFNHRIAWRRNFRTTRDWFCDEQAMQDKVKLGDNQAQLSDEIECTSGCSGRIGSAEYICTDFNVIENWSTGQGENTITIDRSVTSFTAEYSGRAWLTDLRRGGDSDWRVVVSGNLRPRSDNGRINSSPVTAVTPIVRLQLGCQQDFQIPVQDPDKDVVRCRWSAGAECSGTRVCSGFPNGELTPGCELKYDGGGEPGLWPVIIQVEDFISNTSTTALSSVPVQFLVQLFRSGLPCDARPKLVGETPSDGSCILVPFGSIYETSIVAEVVDEDIRIVDFPTVSPIGVTISRPPVQSSFNPLQYYSNVTWTPQPNQKGESQTFCFRARDSNGLESEQSCISLVAVSAPQIKASTVSPTGVIDLTSKNPTQTFSVEFDQMISRPSASDPSIMIYDSSGGIVLSINAQSSDVTYSSPSNDTGILSFTVDLSTLRTGEEYYILLDEGVAVGAEACGQETPSVALSDSTVWRFSIRVDECAAGLDNCSPDADCADTDESFTCTCKTGYSGDGVTCKQIDECAAGLDNCSPDADCTDTDGSFTCACKPGYSGDGVTCEQIDECAAGLDNCSPDADCADTDGSFTCTCKPGYSGDGVTCEQIDECAAGLDNCSPDADCTDTDGSFTCACKPGYSGDGVTCEQIDECAAGLDNCSPDADCADTDGSFTCTCKPGYSGDGVTCEQIDECAAGLDNCSPDADCTDTDGSFTCECKPGYCGDGETCEREEIDECAEGLDNCSPHADCTDTDESFTCTCKSGYSGDGVTCKRDPC